MKKSFTLIQLLAITIILLIIFWVAIIFITGKKQQIDCYYTSNGVICNYGRLGE
jgi:competence protein ComGC